MNDREALDAFAEDSELIVRLEEVLSDFNIFDALGIVRQEVRHSNFLAFLLDPLGTHRLCDYFLKNFLRQIASDSVDSPIAESDIRNLDLGAATVWREWQNIDLLIHDGPNRITCVVENKIDSREHSGQLTRYREIVEREFPDDCRFYVLLSRDGIEPSDDSYLSISYDTIATLVRGLLDDSSRDLLDDLRQFLRHYYSAIRRHIVGDSEIAELCREIYSRHRRALDLIFEYRVDRQAELAGVFKSWVKEAAHLGIVADVSSKNYIRFAIEDWDRHPAQLSSSGWTSSNRLLIFEVCNWTDRIGLWLQMGPGPCEVRESIASYALDHPADFQRPYSGKSKNYGAIHRTELVPQHEYRSCEDVDTILELALPRWQQFLEVELPAIREAMDAFAWPEPRGDENA